MESERLRLTRVAIRGYRSIDSETGVDLDLRDVTLLMGANGSGKSNVVSFFSMLNFMMSGAFQLYVKRCGGCQTLLHYGSDETDAIRGELTFEGEGHTDVYSFTLAYAAPDSLLITEEEVVWQESGKEKPYRSTPKGGYEESGLISAVTPVEKVVRTLVSDCKVYQFHDTSATGPLRQSCEVESNDYLRANGGNLPAFIYRLREHYPESYQMILRYVRSIVPQFGDFVLRPDDTGRVLLKWIDRTRRPDYFMLPHQLSDGTLRFVALATLLLQPPEMMPGLILLDEPELGLHPTAIAHLSELIKTASRHTRLIIATQSPQLMDCFEPEEVAIVSYDKTKCSTVVERLSSDDLSAWLDGYTLSQLWGMNVIKGRP